MNEELFINVEQYINERFAAHDEALEGAIQSLEQTEMPKIAVSPHTGKLLHVLALLCNARRILEIGTLSGYSAIWMARALPANGRLITLEADPRHAQVAQNNINRAGLTEQVEIRIGLALDTLQQLVAEGAEPFDMVFIDADKRPYTDYLEWSLRLSRPGTLIAADNVIRNGRVIDRETDDQSVEGIQRFNDTLATKPDLAATIVPMIGSKGYDGLALALVRR